MKENAGRRKLSFCKIDALRSYCLDALGNEKLEFDSECASANSRWIRKFYFRSALIVDIQRMGMRSPLLIPSQAWWVFSFFSGKFNCQFKYLLLVIKRSEYKFYCFAFHKYLKVNMNLRKVIAAWEVKDFYCNSKEKMSGLFIMYKFSEPWTLGLSWNLCTWDFKTLTCSKNKKEAFPKWLFRLKKIFF